VALGPSESGPLKDTTPVKGRATSAGVVLWA